MLKCECCQSTPGNLITCIICGAKVCRHCAKGSKCLDCYHTELDSSRTFEFNLRDYVRIYQKG